jgi:hypothetical protein
VSDEHEADEFRRFKRSQADLMKSRSVLSEVLKDPKVAKLDLMRRQSDPVEWLRANLVVAGADEDNELLRISLSGDIPEKSTLVNRIARAYVQETINVITKELWSRRDELQKIYNEYQSRLEQRRSDLMKMKLGDAKSKGVDLELLARDQTEYLGELRRVSLSKVAVEARLSRAREKKETEKVEKLEEEMVVLSAQATWLIAVTDHSKARLQESRSHSHFDDGNIRDDIKHLQSMADWIGAEIERLKVEMSAGHRVKLVEEAP